MLANWVNQMRLGPVLLNIYIAIGMKDIQKLLNKLWMSQNVGRTVTVLDDKLFIKSFANNLS